MNDKKDKIASLLIELLEHQKQLNRLLSLVNDNLSLISQPVYVIPASANDLDDAIMHRIIINKEEEDV